MTEKRTRLPIRRPGRPVVAPGQGDPGAARKPVIAPTERMTPATWAAETLQIDTGRLIRRQRNAFLRRMAIFVLLPTLLAAIYTLVIASPRYISEFQIVYRSNDSTTGGGAASTSLIAGFLGASSGIDMTRVLSTYMTSEAMLEAVDKKVDLRGHLSRAEIDWWDRMPANAPKEKFLAYFQRRVSVFEQTGGFLTVGVEGFDRQFAPTLAKAMIEAADTMVSEMTDRPRQDMVAYTEKEMRRYDEALKQATEEITKFRNKYSDYDFSSTVSQLGAVVGGLQGQLAQLRSEMANSRTFLGDTAPTVVVLASRIKALEAQIKAEQDRLAASGGTPGGNGARPGERGAEPYSAVLAKYNELIQAQDFAKQTYLGAKQAYEAARLDAARKQAYVVSFVPPNLPQDAGAPDPLRYVGTTLLGSLILYAIGSLLIGMLRDQTSL